MRILVSLAGAFCLFSGLASSQTFTLDDFRAKRDALTGFSQQFEVTRTFRSNGHTQAATTSLTLDVQQKRYRSLQTFAGGAMLRIFDGEQIYEMEEGGAEYMRTKPSPKDPEPLPNPYRTFSLNLGQAIQRDIAPCEFFSNSQRQCVTFQIPVKSRITSNSKSGVMRVTGGVCYIIFDTGTGLILALRLVENIEGSMEGYQREESYRIKRMSFNKSFDPSHFTLPATATEEVKKLNDENVVAKKKELIGKAAPSLILTDMKGNTIKLSDLKGKTILIDFWATWCGPCRQDAPAIDYLYKKYGAKNLAIIGVSVDEDRATVEKFLSEHPHDYPIALTTENQLPSAYRVNAYPTYVVIDSDGDFAAATSGEKGFSDLRGLLKKAGLETN